MFVMCYIYTIFHEMTGFSHAFCDYVCDALFFFERIPEVVCASSTGAGALGGRQRRLLRQPRAPQARDGRRRAPGLPLQRSPAAAGGGQCGRGRDAHADRSVECEAKPPIAASAVQGSSLCAVAAQLLLSS
eukprot:COSAG05_NODE_486_length_9342_cov_20.072271_2_plen_131_part_00